MTIESLRSKLDPLLSQYRFAKRQVVEEKAALHRAVTHLKHTITAQTLVQEVAETIQNTIHRQIASVVSRCLEAIFDEPYQFKIVFEKRRGKTEARPVFLRDGHEVDPIHASGGGAIDVAAFAGRIAELLMIRPQQRRLVVMDEPFRFLKPQELYGPRICQLLNELAEDFQIQFVMVQNLEGFQTGRMIEVE